MTRSIADAAAVLTVIAGRDPLDNYTLAQPARVPDYTKALSTGALKGKRIGVPRAVFLNQTITVRVSCAPCATYLCSCDTHTGLDRRGAQRV
jgi:Asp-tRNA(Asn)/Glu-tRNA(Gln) amidotransferase A subunit family amidase